MILLQANQIARHFGAEVLFENIHLEISTGARVALVGRNGAGKSTLLKIIAGIEAPDEGKIAKNKTATLGYLAQDTGLDSNETVWNEMLKAFEQVRQMEERMRQLEIFISEGTPDTPAYSSYLKEYDRLQHNFQIETAMVMKMKFVPYCMGLNSILHFMIRKSILYQADSAHV